MRASRERGRSVLFITHRLKEVIAACDRATILRDGGAVATIVPEEGGEETIVEYMLGAEAAQAIVAAVERDADARPPRPPHRRGAGARGGRPVRRSRPGRLVRARIRARSSAWRRSKARGRTTSSRCSPGSSRPRAARCACGGRVLKARHPYDAIRAGVVLVPADRLQALLPQRSVRENIASPRYNTVRRWGPINMRDEGRRVREAEEALQIDTRAARQVRRLSGGNQQKVTIARWLANGFATMLCFDPTRGIDVGTKRQIYALLRRLADDGAAILFFSSELAEFPLVCDRVLTLFGGVVTAELAGRGGRRGVAAARDARAGRERGRVTTATVPVPHRGGVGRFVRRHGWTIGIYVLLLVLVIFWRSQTTVKWGPFDVQSLVIDALPLCFAACAQSIVIISGGIDLSVGSMMSLANVVSAKYMLHMSFDEAILFSIAVVAGAAVIGAITGLTIVVTRVADIIVTLAMLFVLGGRRALGAAGARRRCAGALPGPRLGRHGLDRRGSRPRC